MNNEFDIQLLNVKKDADGRIIEFDIDRRYWGRGIPVGKLLRSVVRGKDQMCCLGFYSLACGLEKSSILNLGMPEQINAHIPNEMLWLDDESSETEESNAGHLAGRNDDTQTSDEQKESFIANYFLNSGIKVNFVN